MSEPAITIENLSKQYHIGASRQGMTFREALIDLATMPLRRLRSFGRSSHLETDTFWALRDVTFDVEPGEVVGIIGRNGAGKSTLLKILSRITEPSEGEAIINGRVGSLLEVGTGFHPELTGRENIHLSAAILGMKRREMAGKFDEIVEFSGIEKFIDTPVKRYSSGMRVRLGFAVAAHLDPEILIIDEVLAVGDAVFRRKCLGMMGDVARGGRTVLFVSHNMTAVRGLCSRCVCLEDGKIAAMGDVDQTIDYYSRSCVTTNYDEVDFRNHPRRARGCTPCITGIHLGADPADPVLAIPMGADLTIRVDLKLPAATRLKHVCLGIEDAVGSRVVSFQSDTQGARVFDDAVTAGHLCCTAKRLTLMPGRYYLTVVVGTPTNPKFDRIEQAISFEITPDDVYGTGRIPHREQGKVFWNADWEFSPR